MVKGELLMALDFARRSDLRHTVVSYCQDGTWYVIKEGPKYRNVYKVTGYDEDGLALLKKLEKKTERRPQEEDESE